MLDRTNADGFVFMYTMKSNDDAYQTVYKPLVLTCVKAIWTWFACSPWATVGGGNQVFGWRISSYINVHWYQDNTPVNRYKSTSQYPKYRVQNWSADLFHGILGIGRCFCTCWMGYYLGINVHPPPKNLKFSTHLPSVFRPNRQSSTWVI